MTQHNTDRNFLDKKVISHLRYSETSEGWNIQTNSEHQEGVAYLATMFANEFGMAEWGHILGLLHDKGKEQKTFQQHILKESGYAPTIKVEGNHNHAYVGALIAKKLFNNPPFYQLMDNILMGHHRGLYDYGDKMEMLKKEIPDDVSIEYLDVNLSLPHLNNAKDIHLLHIFY